MIVVYSTITSSLMCESSKNLTSLFALSVRVMESLAYAELPPLAYQLLVLSTRGHKSLVLEGLQSLFNTLDRRASRDREEEEGEGESWGRWVLKHYHHFRCLFPVPSLSEHNANIEPLI